ncbi:hypothetical protein BJX64DRAFT_280974 [Aspergillus heterothallicus]
MPPIVPPLSDYSPTELPQALLLQDAPLLLENEYLPLEAGYAVAPDGLHHVAASTYMRGCSGKMIDWWFGYVHHTQEYKLWHPRDHVFSDWRGPRENKSSYIGGHHRIHEFIGAQFMKLNVSFVSPEEFFGPDWKEKLEAAGYSTAICGRTGLWDDETDTVEYEGHMIHLIKEEPDGCRMRSRFWMGDFAGVSDPVERAALVPHHMCAGLVKHATEEMAILATRLPSMYADFSTDN